MVFSGVAFLLQEALALPPTLYNLVRTIRMFAIYGFIPIWFTVSRGGGMSDLGLCVPETKKDLVVAIFGGVLVYQIASYVFISNGIFFRGWIPFSTFELAVNLFLVGIMASLTDFWTRGFILLQVSKRYGSHWGLICQNAAWFIIHFYEIQLLNYYIGWFSAIVLTLVLGILGDFIALRTRNLFGLMIGHFLLNLQIALVARGDLVIYTIPV